MSTGTLFDNEEPSIADYWPTMDKSDRYQYLLALLDEHRQMTRERLGLPQLNKRTYVPNQ